MILTHGASSLDRGGGNTVNINGHDYTYVQIGSLFWLTEDLKEPAGTLNTDYRVVANNYYYKYSSENKVNNLISGTGFRIATLSDFQNLFANVTAADLCSVDGWNGLGTDGSGLSFHQRGYLRYSLYNITEGDKWLRTYDPLNNEILGIIINNGVLLSGTNFWSFPTGTQDCFPVRLCKDAT